MQRALVVTTHSAEETRIVGASLAAMLLPGDVLSLSGDLGAGKTVFVQGLAGALGVEHRVTSPSFTLIHQYRGRYPLVHLDVYRLDSFQEVLDLGFEEFLDSTSIVVVEWGEAIAPLLPRKHLAVDIWRGDVENEDERLLVFRPHGAEWVRKVQSMRGTAETLLSAFSVGESDQPRFRVTTDPITREHGGPIEDVQEG